MTEPEEQTTPPKASTPAAEQALVKYKDALDQTKTGVWTPERTTAWSPDPMRPEIIQSISHNPPMCPVCHAKDIKVFLYPFSTNEAGDIDFQCLNAQQMDICGYEAIYRAGTRTFEQHPNKPKHDDWISPAMLYNREPVKPEVETPEGLMSIAEAADLLNIAKADVAAMVVEGKLKTTKHEGKTFLTILDVEALLNGVKTGG